MPVPSVLVKNELDPKSAIHIIQVACKFIDDDGNNDNQSKNTDVPPGGQDILYGTYDHCCRSYIGLMQVRFPNGDTQVIANTKSVDQGYCGGQLTWHLIPAAAIAKDWPSHLEPVQFVID